MATRLRQLLIALTAAAAGGGPLDVDDPDFTVVNPCTFADGSFIDEWGIAYVFGAK